MRFRKWTLAAVTAWFFIAYVSINSVLWDAGGMVRVGSLSMTWESGQAGRGRVQQQKIRVLVGVVTSTNRDMYMDRYNVGRNGWQRGFIEAPGSDAIGFAWGKGVGAGGMVTEDGIRLVNKLDYEEDSWNSNLQQYAVGMMYRLNPLASWYFLVDDDAIVLRANLLRMLDKVYKQHKGKHVIVGRCMHYKRPMRDGKKSMVLFMYGGGGLLINNSLTAELARRNLFELCRSKYGDKNEDFVFFSDARLPLCIKEHLRDVEVKYVCRDREFGVEPNMRDRLALRENYDEWEGIEVVSYHDPNQVVLEAVNEQLGGGGGGETLGEVLPSFWGAWECPFKPPSTTKQHNTGWMYTEKVIRQQHVVFDKGFGKALMNFFGVSSVYDMGAGVGQFQTFSSKYPVKVTSFDGGNNIENIWGMQVDFDQRHNPDRKITGKYIVPGNICWIDAGKPLSVELDKKDWVLSIEVGEHIAEENEGQFLDNLVKLAKKGVVLTWAVEGQPGVKHINNHDNDYIIEQMTKRGLKYDMPQSMYFRKTVKWWPWLRDTIMVFRFEKEEDGGDEGEEGID